MKLTMVISMGLAFIFRWTARLWSLASTVVLLLFAFGGRERLPVGADQLILFLLFPVGPIIGFAVAWRREILGGVIGIGSFALLNLWTWTTGGRLLINGYFLVLIAPAVLHLIGAFLLARVGQRARHDEP